jgi:hypothetical protein
MPFEEDYSELIVTSMRPKVITVASRRDAKTVESGYSNVLQHAAFIARQLDSRVRPDPLPILHPASQISLFIGGTSMRLEITITSRRDANAVELGHRNVPQSAAFITRQLDSRVRRDRRLKYLSLPASQVSLFIDGAAGTDSFDTAPREGSTKCTSACSVCRASTRFAYLAQPSAQALLHIPSSPHSSHCS